VFVLPYDALTLVFDFLVAAPVAMRNREDHIRFADLPLTFQPLGATWHLPAPLTSRGTGAP
jgi:hypothetical protein